MIAKINQIYLGDCIEVMQGFDENSIDSIVTDPPYGLEFMGKEWDKLWDKRTTESQEKKLKQGKEYAKNFKSVINQPNYKAGKEAQDFHYLWATECLRVLKSGGHLLSFGGTRTYHRMVCAIEDAGFEIRDTLQWLYGSGFPKSLNIGKQIDKKPNMQKAMEFRKKLNEFREQKGISIKSINEYFGFATTGSGVAHHWFSHPTQPTIPTQEQYKEVKKILDLDDSWDEIYYEAEREIIAIDKNRGKKGAVPISGYGEFDVTIPKTDLAKQWDGWGTGLKPACEMICLARKPISEKNIALNVLKWGTGGINIDGGRIESGEKMKGGCHGKIFGAGKKSEVDNSKGRFPSNVLLDEEAAELLDQMSGKTKSDGGTNPITNKSKFGTESEIIKPFHYKDIGGASRFFYVAKASKSERNAGLEGSKFTHPTVKPIKLMRYLVRLITPPGGICLDPFLGSGTTAIACIEEGFDYIGIEKEKEYFDIAEKRIFHYKRELKLF